MFTWYMRQSQLFGKTIKEVPSSVSNKSTEYLLRGGFIQESTAGRYYMLPLGMRVQDRIVRVIEQEMNATGAQKMITPILHPIELWRETNRTSSAGFELTKVEDRRGAEFVLGGTAEEMIVDLVRRFNISYKDLPFHLYQFSKKFRDEMRARGGLLRVREFLMKDGYSFHANEEDFKKEYEKMKEVYSRIFSRFNLKTFIVESDNGYIGGDYCHEFIVESEVGESKVLMTEDGTYAAHEDVAIFERDNRNIAEGELPVQQVEAERGPTMEDGVTWHNKPLWQQIKDVLFVDENGRNILAIIRGDYEVNEVKLAHLVGVHHLRLATDQEVRANIDSEPGFISPVGIKKRLNTDVELIIVADISLRTIKNAYGGANKKHRDLLNVNIDRDYQPDIEGDIALAKEEYLHDGKKFLQTKGIEVGNIFQLGTHYSSRMNATFTDENGKEKEYYMGCYGIGIGRTMATIVEVHHDEHGIIWPQSAAPFDVHLLVLGKSSGDQAEGDRMYEALQKHGIDVLYDDRPDVRAGEKFADSDLIGIPVRLIISPKTREQQKVEVKFRGKDEVTLVTANQIVSFIKKIIR